MRISDWSSDVCSSDLNLAEWLRRAGGDSPPLHIASGLVDHAGWIIMALIAVGGIAAYIGLRSPLMIRALEVAIDTPSQGSSALWLTVKNRSRKIGRASCRERVCQYV